MSYTLNRKLKEEDLKNKFGGTIFRGQFRKKDGTRRPFIGRLIDDKRSDNVVTYWDTKKQGYRRFDPSTLLYAVSKRGYFVDTSKDPNTKKYSIK